MVLVRISVSLMFRVFVNVSAMFSVMVWVRGKVLSKGNGDGLS